jgi:hypothetical protein
MLSPRTFWLLIFALSLLNFGADLITAGSAHLSGWDLMVMTGSWLAVGGIAVLVWLITGSRARNGNGNRK